MADNIIQARDVVERTRLSIRRDIAFALMERDRANGDMRRPEYVTELKRLADVAELYDRLRALLTESSSPQEQSNDDLSNNNTKAAPKRSARRKTAINKVGE